MNVGRASRTSSTPRTSCTSTPRQNKSPEKLVEAAESAAKQFLESHNKVPPRLKPGLSLEKKIELEKRRKLILINEHNRLRFTVKEKESRLNELLESLKDNSFQPTSYKSEEDCKQRIRQLENNQDKMKVKTTEAREIQNAYWHIREHLQQEVRDIFKVLDQKERAVALGQTEVDKATKAFQAAAADTDSTLGKMVEVENETMQRKREMDSKLFELTAEEKELKREMETMGRLSPTGKSRQKEQENEEEEYEETPPSPEEENHLHEISGASQCDMKLVEDMEALREALGCADVQDLVNKVVSQRATKEQLLTDVTRYENVIRHEEKTMADLELHYAELKFGAKPAASRFEKPKEEMQEQLKQEVDYVQRLQAELKRSQDLLDTVEQGVNNLYFRMSCVPVEGLPTVCVTDSIDKLRDISARLPTVLQKTSQLEPEISNLGQEKVYSLLEQVNRMENRNIKRPTTPIDALQLSDEEEDTAPSRDEIKRNSCRLIEAEQNKKNKKAKKAA